MICHNLRGYHSHLIFKELNKFNCSISVIPNGLEKYMSFTLNKNIIHIDGILFMNSSLDKLLKNLNYFKYLSSGFSGEKLELVKKKGVYPYEYLDGFKRFKENRLPDIDCFFNSLKIFVLMMKNIKELVMCGKFLVLKILENIMIYI